MRRFNLSRLLRSSMFGILGTFLVAGGFAGCDTQDHSNRLESQVVEIEPALTAEDNGFTFTASNGYEFRVVEEAQSGEAPSGGSVEVISPAGEIMTVGLTQDDLEGDLSRSLVVLDGSTNIDYTIASIPGAAEPEQEWEQFKITKGNTTLVAEGLPRDADESYELDEDQEAAFGLLVNTLATSHSKGFYEGLDVAYDELIVAIADANLDIECALAIFGYVGSFGGLAACGTVIGCVPAIAVHWAAMASVGLACS